MTDEKMALTAHTGIQYAYNAVNQESAETINYKPRIEPEEAIQKAFEEIAASSVRILKSIERLNSLAEETSGELHAAKGALLLKERA